MILIVSTFLGHSVCVCNSCDSIQLVVSLAKGTLTFLYCLFNCHIHPAMLLEVEGFTKREKEVKATF